MILIYINIWVNSELGFVTLWLCSPLVLQPIGLNIDLFQYVQRIDIFPVKNLHLQQEHVGDI